jgi:hypothetical protein
MQREKESVVRLTVPIKSAIHYNLKMAARKDRRSTANLINLILERWIQELKGGENE